MKYNLKKNDISICINNYGAYVESFQRSGETIFFPKVLTKINDQLKKRGGMHPCIPNFGEDKITNLSQHGFGRDEYWDILSSGEDYIDLKLVGEGLYEDVYFYINYKIDQAKLITSLNIYNRSSKTVNLAPGFHPYFYCKDFDFEIEDFKINPKEDLSQTLFLESDRIKFRISNKNFQIIGQNIKKFAIWTDFCGDYVCIEPTYRGSVFTEDNKDIYKIKKNEEFSMEFSIELLENK